MNAGSNRRPNPFDLTDDDMKQLGLHGFPLDMAPPPFALFNGAEVHTNELAGRWYAWAELPDRLFIGQGDTLREAFLAMVRHPGVPHEQKTAVHPVLTLAWDQYCRELTGDVLPVQWKSYGKIDPRRRQ